MTLVAATLIAALVATAVAIVLSAWHIVIVLMFPSLQHLPCIDVRALPHHAQQQWGGGARSETNETDEALNTRAITVANALRRLGETVKRPGIKAIAAVLRMRAGDTQSAAAAQTGAGADSIRKYRPLVDTVLGASMTGAAILCASTVGGSVATGVVGGALVAAALMPCVKALPNVTNVSLASESACNDGRIFRVWRATVRAPDGTLHERVTQPVLHEPALPDEPSEAARKRENREHKRMVYALRALDAEASAAYRTKKQLRDRLQKRKLAAKRAAELPALPIPDGDEAWFLPLNAQPHFIGEHVWLLGSDGCSPQPSTVVQLYRDGSADVELCSNASHVRAPSKQLVRIVTDEPLRYMRAPGELVCPYGAKCLESSELHWKLYDHPDDHPWVASARAEGTVQVPIHVGRRVIVECSLKS